MSKIAHGLQLSQVAYIKELLKRARMLDAKHYLTPMISGLELSKSEGTFTVDGKFLPLSTKCYPRLSRSRF